MGEDITQVIRTRDRTSYEMNFNQFLLEIIDGPDGRDTAGTDVVLMVYSVDDEKSFK